MGKLHAAEMVVKTRCRDFRVGTNRTQHTGCRHPVWRGKTRAKELPGPYMHAVVLTLAAISLTLRQATMRKAEYGESRGVLADASVHTAMCQNDTTDLA
ncbi:hypothetical protein MTO96_020556 [Rhipicephalus appendiculatus]